MLSVDSHKSEDNLRQVIDTLPEAVLGVHGASPKFRHHLNESRCAQDGFVPVAKP
jgi:hypothetical protein